MKRTKEEFEALTEMPFCDAVTIEREYQDRIFGEVLSRAYTWPEWLAVLVEEVGEVSHEIIAENFFGLGIDKLRMELIQVAAVCAAMVAVIDEEKSNG